MYSKSSEPRMSCHCSLGLITRIMHFSKTAAHREYLEDYVLIFGKIPQGEHDIPGVGKIDLERLSLRVLDVQLAGGPRPKLGFVRRIERASSSQSNVLDERRCKPSTPWRA
jgi:hypothetical protein